jgi:hypothetical protein
VNQDFALLLTPAIARRLLRLPSRPMIDLPPEVAEIAEQDRIPLNEFDSFICPPTPERVAISQFMLDCNMRGSLEARYHPCMDETSILNVARLTRSPVTVLTTRRKDIWRDAAKNLFMTNVTYRQLQERDDYWIDDHCRDVLIFDLQIRNSIYLAARLAREFARTFIYVSYTVPDEQTPNWTGLAGTLFPDMPNPTLRHLGEEPLQSLAQRAAYYNNALFLEYISDTKLKEIEARMLSSKD